MDIIYIISFGIAGIIIDLVLLIFVLIFEIKKLDMNSLMGYRTRFSLSSKEAWDWANKVFNTTTIIVMPMLLILHIDIFIFSLIESWSALYITLSMFTFVPLLLFEAIYIEVVGRQKI